MPIRALFFVDAPHRLAGAQRSLLAALRGLAAYGVEPRVVVPGDGAFVEACRAADMPVRVLPGTPAHMTFGKRLLDRGMFSQAAIVVRDFVPYARELARLAEREHVDVFHFNTPRGILEAGLAARLAGRASVLHLRVTPVGFGRFNWIVAQSLASRIVLVAASLRRHVLRPLRGRCRVVHNGIAPFESLDRVVARGRLGVDPDECVLVSLSSPVPFKGLHHLLDAAARLRPRIRARWFLAGDGPDAEYETWLRRRCEALGLGDRVTFCGFVAEPLALLAAADVLVLPSVARETLDVDGKLVDVRGTEGLPRSILEAMALGIPVVASRVAGVEEEVEDGHTGRLVPPSDPGALAEAVYAVASDPEWRRAAGLRAREVIAARFTAEAAARGLADVLKEGLSPGRKPGVAERLEDAA